MKKRLVFHLVSGDSEDTRPLDANAMRRKFIAMNFEFDLGVFSIIITVSSAKQPQIKCCHILFCHFRRKHRGGLGLFISDPRTILLPLFSSLSNFIVRAILIEDFGICK